GRRVHDKLDRNGDGKVGPRERRIGRRVHDKLDRNGDGKVGPRERRGVRRIRRGRRAAGPGR
ncbi:MAG: hypothetical protein ACE5F1_17260, partial [Planctomycetota bacterium]